MKQYTNESQTAKLIELGFEKPKSIGGYEPTFEVHYEGAEVAEVIIGADKNAPIYAYSIGELIEMLPIELEDVGINTTLTMHFDNNIANVEYIGVLGIEYSIMKEELIDALYEMLVKLKEERVI